MPTCIEYMRERLENRGYRVHHQAKNDLIVAEQSPYTAERQQIWVCNVNAPITPEDIRRCFDFKGHLLFIVDEKLIPDDVAQKETTPMWLRVLHGLYLGRIYVWNGRGVYSVHFDWDTGDISASGYIPVDDLRCQENNSWLKGWGAMYRLAYLHDRAWWKAAPYGWGKNARYADEPPNTSASGGWKYDPDSGFAYHEKDWPGGKPPEPPKPPPKPADYFGQFAACRDARARRQLWMKLLKAHHPDTLGVDAPQTDIDRATKITQEINQAYQKAEKVL